jgi:hypothetical protein
MSLHRSGGLHVWLPPGMPLSSYAMRTYATKPWTNATVSVYPATVGTSPTAEWLQLSQVGLALTAEVILGTECYEPGSVPPVSGAAAALAPGVVSTATPARQHQRPCSRWRPRRSGDATATGDSWLGAGFTPAGLAGADAWIIDSAITSAGTLRATLDLRDIASPMLSFQSRCAAGSSQAAVQVSLTADLDTLDGAGLGRLITMSVDLSCAGQVIGCDSVRRVRRQGAGSCARSRWFRRHQQRPGSRFK